MGVLYIKAMDLACVQALSQGSGAPEGWGVGKERELAIMSHEFEYLRPKSGRKMLIGRFDQVMMYYTFHVRNFLNTNNNGRQL